MQSVLFVCLGNICRSPAAEGIFTKKLREYAKKNKLDISNVIIDSAGTGKWHVGEAPDKRMIKVAKVRGYDISDLKARQVILTDFYMFDLILAMDLEIFREIKELAPEDNTAELKLFMDYHPDENLKQVADPYFGKEEKFHKTIDLIEQTMPNLLEEFSQPQEISNDDLIEFEF